MKNIPMVQGLALHFTTREDAQQCMRILKKSGAFAQLSAETILTSMEMVCGTIDSIRAFIGGLSVQDEEEREALGIVSEMIGLEEGALSRIVSAIEEDGGTYLRAISEKADSLSDEERDHLKQDAIRVLAYVKDGYIDERDDRLVLLKKLVPGSHTVTIPAPLLLFPEKDALDEAGLTGERVVSSEMVYSVRTGPDMIFCSDPTELIDSLEGCNPEEESFVSFLEQFFLLLTLADEVVSFIQEGAVTTLEITGNLSAKMVLIDEETYPLRFDVSHEMVVQMVDALRSAGRISGKDGRLKVR